AKLLPVFYVHFSGTWHLKPDTFSQGLRPPWKKPPYGDKFVKLPFGFITGNPAIVGTLFSR
ncbi:MAG: hypothetical protein DRH50_06345, partial [Deltaproteobacteria bacterium]